MIQVNSGYVATDSVTRTLCADREMVMSNIWAPVGSGHEARRAATVVCPVHVLPVPSSDATVATLWAHQASSAILTWSDQLTSRRGGQAWSKIIWRMRIFGAALCLAMPSSGMAQDTPSEAVVALDALVQEALDNSPEIARARQHTEAAEAFVPQARTLPDPQIVLGYRDLGQREMELGVRQEFPFPGKLRLRGDIASKTAEQRQQETEAARRRVVAQLKTAYYELSLTYRSMAVLEQNRQILVDFEQTARSRYSVGQSAQQDVLRAQTEISRILTRIAIVQQQRESFEAEINRHLNRPPRNPLGRPLPVAARPLKISLDELNTLIDRASPMVQAQVRGVERGDRALELARREYLPDFDLDVLGMRDANMRTNGFRVMLGVRVPLYYTSRQQEGVREALAMRRAAENDLQATRQELLFQIKDSFVRAQRAEQLANLLSEVVIPQATLTLRSAQAGYSVGSVDFLTLLSSLLTLQENRLELETETVEHAKAVARLEEVVGEVP